MDTDGSGYHDLDEVRDALKKVKGQAEASIKDCEAKAVQVSKAKRRASQKTHYALHQTRPPTDQPDKPKSPPSSPDGSPGGAPERGYIASLFSQRGGLFMSEEQRAIKMEEKQAKAVRDQRARLAMLAMGNYKLGKAWISWVEWRAARLVNMQLVASFYGRMQNLEMLRGWAVRARHIC